MVGIDLVLEVAVEVQRIGRMAGVEWVVKVALAGHDTLCSSVHRPPVAFDLDERSVAVALMVVGVLVGHLLVQQVAPGSELAAQ